MKKTQFTFLLLTFIIKSLSAQIGFKGIEVGFSSFQSLIDIYDGDQIKNESAIIESANGNLGYGIQTNLILYDKKKSNISVGLNYFQNSSSHLVSNIRFANNIMSFEVSNKLKKIAVGVPFSFARDLKKKDKFELRSKLGITPVKVFYDLFDIESDKQSPIIESFLEDKNRIDIKSLNLFLSLSLPIVFYIGDYQSISIEPFCRTNLITNENYLMINKSRDIHYGVNLYYFFLVAK